MRVEKNVPEIRFEGFSDEWVEKPLNHEVELFSGLTYSPKDIRKEGVFVIRSSNVKNGQIVQADNVYVNPEVVNCSNVKKGDIIVVVRNGSRALIGKHAQVNSLMDNTVIGAFMTGVRASYPEFINALFDTDKFKAQVEKNLGATINQITNGAFNCMVFMFPEGQEKTAIGNTFQKLDNLINQHQQKHDKLSGIKKAMLEKMFPKQGETMPEIRFGGFGGEWEVKELSQVSDKITEKNTSLVYSETFTNSAEFGIISQRDYFDNDISNSNNIGGYYVVQPEDFVYNPRISTFAPCGPINRNTLGRAGVMSPLYSVFRTKGVNTIFIEYFFQTKLWHAFMFLNGDTGARADRFSIKDSVFFELPLLLPTVNEQSVIGNYFQKLDALINQHQQQITKLNNIKQACLSKMFV